MKFGLDPNHHEASLGYTHILLEKMVRGRRAEDSKTQFCGLYTSILLQRHSTKRRPAMAWYLNTDDTDDESKYQPMDSLQVI